MGKTGFESWLKRLGKAWSDLDPEAAASLFSKDCQYYESPLEEPCKSWGAILKLWLAVPTNQKDVSFEFKVLSVADGICISNWKVARTLVPGNRKQVIDGIFQFSLDQKGLCDYLKQWRAAKIYGP